METTIYEDEDTSPIRHWKLAFTTAGAIKGMVVMLWFHLRHQESFAQIISILTLITKRQDSDLYTLQFFFPVSIMQNAFWSFIQKIITIRKYMKRHNRFYLLTYKNMVTLYFFIEIVLISFICINGKIVGRMFL